MFKKIVSAEKDEVFVKKQNYLFNCLLGKFEKLSTSYKMNLIEQFIKRLHVQNLEPQQKVKRNITKL